MTPEPPIPHTLYKYVDNINAVIRIIQGTIKFASFYELNDATEAASFIDDVAIEKDLWKIQHSGLTEEQHAKLKLISKFLVEAKWAEPLNIVTIDNAKKYILDNSPEDVKKLLDILPIKLKGLIDRNETHSLYYFCLSKKYDSLSMWTHYAKRGHGFVLVFSNLDKCFTKSDPWEFDGLHRVRYSKKRPPITFDPMTLENLFLTKTNDWRHEKEIRVIKPAKDLDFFPPEDNRAFPMKYLQINPAYVSGVICGYEIDKRQCAILANELVEYRRTLTANKLLVSQAILKNNGPITKVEVDKIANK